jgi:hypothetical protein
LNPDAARLPKTVKAMQDGSVDFGACDDAYPNAKEVIQQALLIAKR